MAKEFPGSTQVGVIVGGDVNDPAPDLSGNFKVWSPTEHNPQNYPKDSLPFTTILEPATKASQSEFGGVPDPSSMVMTMKTQGGPPVVIGQFRDFANPNKTVGGNGNLMMSGLNFYNVWNTGLGMMKTAKVVEKNEGGVPIRRRENPQEYKPSDLQGLPNHGALFEMAGHRWPQVQNIETAVQHFNQVLNSSMIGQMSGSSSSVSGALKKLKPEQKKKIKEKVPDDIFNSLESMIALMPEIEGGNTFVGDFRVHPEVFANNVVDVLSQATTISDLQDAMQMLHYDESVRGLDELPDVEINMEGPFGNTTLKLSANGKSSSSQSDKFQQAIQKFSSFLNSAQAASVNKGQNMFGSSAKTIADMIQRVAPETQAKVKETLEKIHTSKEQIKLSELIQTGGAKALTQSILKGLG